MPKDEKPSKPKPAGQKPRAGVKATGPDHPTQSEHAHQAYQKLHGESDKRTQQSPGFKPPGRTKGGFDPKGFNPRQTRGANIPRKTQGK